MLLLPRYRVVNIAVPDFSASAIALAPYGPMLLEPRGQRRHQLQVRPDQVVVGGLEALWPEQLAVAHHAREHDRAMHAAR